MTTNTDNGTAAVLAKIEEYLECVKSSKESLAVDAFVGMLPVEMLEITEARCEWHNGESLASLEVCIGNSYFFRVYCDIDRRSGQHVLSYVNNEYGHRVKLTANNIHEFYEYVAKAIKLEIQTTESVDADDDDLTKVSEALRLLEEMEQDLALELALKST